jgi:hypothetical protein
MIEDRPGAIWVGTTVGLFRLIRTRGEWTLGHPEFTPPIGEAADGLLEDDEGALWIAFYTGRDAKLIDELWTDKLTFSSPLFPTTTGFGRCWKIGETASGLARIHGLALLLGNPKSGGPH